MTTPEVHWSLFTIVLFVLVMVALVGATVIANIVIWCAMKLNARTEPDYTALGEAVLEQDDETLVTIPLRWQKP